MLTFTRRSARRPSMRRLTAGLLTLPVSVALVLFTGSPSLAAPTRHEGSMVVAMGEWCDLGYEAATAASVAGLIYDDAAPPKAGEVFYAYVEVAATAEPCVEQSMIPDIVLPSGLSLAVSVEHPIRCVRWDYSSGQAVEYPETSLCPKAPSPGVSGGSWSFPTAQGDLWPLPYQTGYEIQVPVVARSAGTLDVRFYSQLIDGVTDPILRTTSPRVTLSAETASVRAAVRDVVRLGRTGGKVPVQVVASPQGATLRVALAVRRDGRWVGIAAQTARVTGDRMSLKISVPSRWRRLVSVRDYRARVVATVRTDSGAADRAVDRFILKR